MKLIMTTLFAGILVSSMAFGEEDPGFSMHNNASEQLRVYIANFSDPVDFLKSFFNDNIKMKFDVPAKGIFKGSSSVPGFDQNKNTFLLILKGTGKRTEEQFKAAFEKIADKVLPLGSSALTSLMSSKIKTVAQKFATFLPACLVTFKSSAKGKTLYIKYKPDANKMVQPQSGTKGIFGIKQTSEGYSLEKNVEEPEINDYCI